MNTEETAVEKNENVEVLLSRIDKSETRTLTIGEQRIGIVFKKGNNDKVQNLKEHFAHLINVVDKTKKENNGREVAIAITEIENASHWATKSLFK